MSETRQPPPNRRLFTMGRVTTLLATPIAGFLATALALDLYGYTGEVDGTYDAIVVAGARVESNGLPGANLDARTRRGVELYKAGVAPIIIFTGGVGEHAPSEAHASSKLAVSLGVPVSAHILEEASTSTEENASLTIGMTSARRVIVVTDTYHVFRVKRVFARYYDHVDAVPVEPPLDKRAYGSLREVLAVGYYLYMGWL